MEREVGASETDRAGLTRREVLLRGTFLGAGAAWSAPMVRTLTMSQDYAAATSAEVEPVEVTTPTTTTVPTEVGGISVTKPDPSQVQASGELPLTGLEVGDTAILGAGLMAAGAALIRATKPDPERSQS